MSLKPSLRFKVFKRDAFTCRYCGRQSPQVILEVDHIMPKSKGGPDELENLVTSCSDCNRGKAAKTLDSVPAESDLHQKAVDIRERELQMAEYTHWQRIRKEREDRELEELYELWNYRWGSCWEERSARRYLRELGVVEVSDILRHANAHARKYGDRTWAQSAWVYFCSICRSEIEKRGGYANP